VALDHAEHAARLGEPLAPLDAAVDEQEAALHGLARAPPLGEVALGALAVGLHEVHGAVEQRDRVRRRRRAVGPGLGGVAHRHAHGVERPAHRGGQVAAGRVQPPLDARAPPRAHGALAARPHHRRHRAPHDRQPVVVPERVARLRAVEERGEGERGLARRGRADAPRPQGVPLERAGRDHARRLRVAERLRLERRAPVAVDRAGGDAAPGEQRAQPAARGVERLGARPRRPRV
jgi:hypothetical protein